MSGDLLTSQAATPEQYGGGRIRPRLVRALMIIGVQVVLIAGFWGLFVDRGGHDAPAVPVAVRQIVDIPGGVMRVERVTPWTSGGHVMAGSGLPQGDQVPKGQRRVLVDVTLLADSGSRLAYRPDAFAVTAPGLKATRPYSATPGLETIAPTAQATVTLVFQVPAKATGLVMSLEGADDPVLLEGTAAPAPAEHGSDHSDAPAAPAKP